MKVKDIFYGVCLTAFVNLPLLFSYMVTPTTTFMALTYILFGIFFICVNVLPSLKKHPTRRLYFLATGGELLQMFSLSTVLSVMLHILLGYRAFMQIVPWQEGESGLLLAKWIGCVLFTVILEAVLFWNGIIRVYLTSVQLGIKHRVLAALLWFVPIINVWYLVKIIQICALEVMDETEKIELNNARAENEVCKTKYPLLFVHGVFFRDFHYVNYWGRIPAELIKNGAEIYYGSQQSADTVENCGKELAERICEIVEKTGCEKVNIIAHSKGGLDSRAAIARFGAEPYVASLTTINTPHRGCIFAEYLLKKAPKKFRNAVAESYNSALLKLGDTKPDFLGAVNDLTESACLKFNENTADSPEVLYESVMSYCRRARNGQFPLNISYHLVKHFDGQNDGLVSVESAKWGSKFTLVEPKGKRGISHGDMVDLNRENLRDFDVREFYVSLVSALKERGY